MNKTLISFLVATFLVVAIVEGAQNDLLKKNLVQYVRDMAQANEADLNTKEIPELLDMAIAAIQKLLSDTRDVGRIALLKEHLKYYQGLKDGPAEPAPDAVHHVDSEQDFDEQVKNAGDKLVVVDFFATWCGPCVRIAPTLEKLAKQYQSEIVVLKVDVDQESDLAMGRYVVSSMPTFVFLKNGETVERFSGANAEKIEETIKKHK